MCVYVALCVYVGMYACLYVLMHACMCVGLCMYVYMKLSFFNSELEKEVEEPAAKRLKIASHATYKDSFMPRVGCRMLHAALKDSREGIIHVGVGADAITATKLLGRGYRASAVQLLS